jgi:hypothetical protein
MAYCAKTGDTPLAPSLRGTQMPKEYCVTVLGDKQSPEQEYYQDIDTAMSSAAGKSLGGCTTFVSNVTFVSGQGYPGRSQVVAYFKNGEDTRATAADEDGVPDPIARSKAWRQPAIRPLPLKYRNTGKS